jgi:undecaprenyl-diphosphatase
VVSGGWLLLVAVVLGVVEGVTEFVPVSSTGHLILAGHWLAFPEDKAAAFDVFIQLGGVLALLWFYRVRLWSLATTVPRERGSRAFVAKVMLAFVPAALVGFLSHAWIVRVLFAPLPVAAALAVGGVGLIVLDKAGAEPPEAARAELTDVSWAQALVVGCVQTLALWPGVSRSGATIIGGLVAGLSRTVALEFSFFLAIPTLGAASVFALWESRKLLVAADLPIFAVGLGVSFAVSLAAIAGLLRYVRSRDLHPFGWYRIVLGAAVAARALLG